jgi:tagatose 1,6-diphosphate aldolase
MSGISIGKLRGLQQIADEKGMLTVCAVDHRGSLRKALAEAWSREITYQDVVDFKLDLCHAVAPSASAVLLDPVFGVAPTIAAGQLPGHVGLLVSLEKTGYTGGSASRVTELLPDWGVAKIKRLGASAVKLLVYYRPDLGEVSARQRDLVARVSEECLVADIPLLVESVSYPVEGETSEMFSARKPELVIESARQLTELPFDVLKSEFPADIHFERDEAKLAAACKELNAASKLPWALLSAGVNFELFKMEAEIAFSAGASGFLAGRALWQEATPISDRAARREFFNSTVQARLSQLTRLADSYGTPWYAKVGSSDGHFPPIAEGWYQNY